MALTGATGFTGSFVLPQLLAAGHEVVALARKPEVLAGKCAHVIAGDLADGGALDELVSGADVVLHMGGAVAAKNRAAFFDINVEGTKRLFLAARAAQVKRFVFISSLTARQPQLSDYGASKAAAEQYLLPFDDEDCDVLILRPPAIYGPGDMATLPIFKALQASLALVPGKAQSRFSLLYVSDFAKVACESVDATAHGIFELDDQSMGYEWSDLVRVNRAVTGYPRRVLQLPQALVHAYAAMGEVAGRLKNEPPIISRQKVATAYHGDLVANGWIWPIAQPVKLEQGLAQTLEWYWQHGWLPRKNGKAGSRA